MSANFIGTRLNLRIATNLWFPFTSQYCEWLPRPTNSGIRSSWTRAAGAILSAEIKPKYKADNGIRDFMLSILMKCRLNELNVDQYQLLLSSNDSTLQRNIHLFDSHIVKLFPADNLPPVECPPYQSTDRFLIGWGISFRVHESSSIGNSGQSLRWQFFDC